MGRLTKKRFNEIAQEFNLLAAPHQLDGMYLMILKEVEGEDPAHLTNKFIAIYSAAFKERYGVYPAMSPPDRGAAKNIVKSQGFDKATELMKAYVQSNDPYFRQRTHDLLTLQANLNRVNVSHNTGMTYSRTEAQADDRKQSNAQAARNYLASLEGEAE